MPHIYDIYCQINKTSEKSAKHCVHFTLHFFNAISLCANIEQLKRKDAERGQTGCFERSSSR